MVQAYNNIVKIEALSSKKTPKKDLWKYNQIVLRTAIVLIHQGIEGLMKSFICDESPLLLIGNRRSDWKTLPNDRDESFSVFYTIGEKDLLKTFYSCIDKEDEIDEKFILHYEEIRVKRNNIVHGVGEKKLTPEYVIKLILRSFTYLLGKDSFWDAVLGKFADHPGLKYKDREIVLEIIFQYQRMDYLYECLGARELKHHFNTDITSRAYYCPECSRYMNITPGDKTKSKCAFLDPNTPESRTLNCIVCQIDFKIERENCTHDSCKGNAKYFAKKEVC